MHETHAARRARLAARIAGLDADAALITGPVNVRYLTGLVSSNAALLVMAEESGSPNASGRPHAPGSPNAPGAPGAILCTDGRYAGMAERVCPDLETVVARPVAQTLIDRAAALGACALAFEAHHLTVESFEALTWPPGLRATPLGHVVEELRSVKDDTELSLLARACEITDRAFADLLPRLRPGLTERQIATDLERRMVDLGAEAPAFDSIVASGPNGAVPHHVPEDRPLERGDLVTIDFGARYGGYHADMTRTVAIGTVAGWQRELYDLVAAAQAAGVAAAVPGATIDETDGAARSLIEEAGHGADFPHGLGHGVGLEIHEAPLLGPGRTGKLADRIPITAEPGVYLAGRGGVRIEDTLVVSADGPQLLTTTTKELLVL